MRKALSAAILTVILSLSLGSCSKKDKMTTDGETKYTNAKVTIYFTQASDDLGVILIPVKRRVPEGRTKYETAVQELFLGPNQKERDNNDLNTEVPEGCRLISVDENNKSIKLNISGQFLTGGGSETMQARFRQLRETILNLAKGRPVYLYVDGVKAVTIGGEGLEVPQPLQ